MNSPPSLSPLSLSFPPSLQVSYAATSPVLSDRTMYPLFYRTSPAETLYNDARFALMNMYNWCYVATLHQTANIFSLVSPLRRQTLLYCSYLLLHFLLIVISCILLVRIGQTIYHCYLNTTQLY